MQAVHNAHALNYFRHLTSVARNVDGISENHGSDIFVLDDQIDGFFLVKDADAGRRQLEVDE